MFLLVSQNYYNLCDEFRNSCSQSWSLNIYITQLVFQSRENSTCKWKWWWNPSCLAI